MVETHRIPLYSISEEVGLGGALDWQANEMRWRCAADRLNRQCLEHEFTIAARKAVTRAMCLIKALLHLISAAEVDLKRLVLTSMPQVRALQLNHTVVLKRLK